MINWSNLYWLIEVALLLAGQEPGWRSSLLPSTTEALRASLSTEFLSMMDDPQYHQLKAPISWSPSGDTHFTISITVYIHIDTWNVSKLFSCHSFSSDFEHPTWCQSEDKLCRMTSHLVEWIILVTSCAERTNVLSTNHNFPQVGGHYFRVCRFLK